MDPNLEKIKDSWLSDISRGRAPIGKGLTAAYEDASHYLHFVLEDKTMQIDKELREFKQSMKEGLNGLQR